jgi:ComF family protein
VLRDIETMVERTPGYRRYFEGATLVPVPLHAIKLRERGFNQSERIAKLIARRTDAEGVASLLERTVFTQTQTRLSRNARDANVKNAFALAPDAVVIPDHRYILIDDVFTTGSTLNACAAVLREAGATRLKVATLGHG